MSFLNRAKEAAQAAAEQAQQAAGMATKSAQDPATQEKLGQQARSALGAARRGVSTVVERIDPGVLADLIIKSTALQEMTLFPALFTQLVALGEETGQMHEFLRKAADLFEQRSERALSRIVVLAEPVMIVVLAIIVGSVALSMLQAIYGVNASAFR